VRRLFRYVEVIGERAADIPEFLHPVLRRSRGTHAHRRLAVALTDPEVVELVLPPPEPRSHRPGADAPGLGR